MSATVTDLTAYRRGPDSQPVAEPAPSAAGECPTCAARSLFDRLTQQVREQGAGPALLVPGSDVTDALEGIRSELAHVLALVDANNVARGVDDSDRTRHHHRLYAAQESTR